MKRKFWLHGFALACATALSACGGGGGSDDGQMKVSVTDAPVDDAKRVVVTFTQIDAKPQGGDPISFPLAAPAVIDLLEFTDGLAIVVLPPVTLPAGDYEWLRLHVVDGVNNSFVELDDGGIEPIRVPSGRLQVIKGFDVPEGGLAALTIDFDLRKALVDPVGQDGFLLKPTALRVVEDDQVGKIVGTVDASLVTGSGCPATLPTPEDNAGRAVYVYAGSNAVADDIGGVGTQPVVSSFVRPTTVDGVTTYRYTVAYLPASNYTVAFTCQGDLDNPEADDAITFPAQGNATVSAGGTTTLNLPVPPPAP